MGNSYYALAYNYMQLSDYSNSIKYLKKALISFNFHKLKGRLAFCNRVLAVNYMELGKYEQSNTYFEQSLAFFRQTKGEMSLEVGGIYNSLGTVYKNLKNYNKAEVNYNKALEIFDSIDPSGIESAMTLINKGNFWNGIGKYNLAKKDLNKALQVFQSSEKSPFIQRNIALTLSALGLVFKNNNELNQGIDLLGKALQLRKKLGKGRKTVDLNESYHNLGDIYLLKKDYQQALRYFQKAIQQQVYNFNNEDIFSNPDFEKVGLLGANSDLLLDFSFKARSFFFWYLESNDFNHLRAAHQTYQKTAELIDLMRSEFSANGSKLFWMKETFPIYEKGIEVALKMYQLTGEESYKEQAFQLMEKNKAILLLEAVNTSEIELFVNIPDSLLQLQQQLAKKISQQNRIITELKQQKETVDSLLQLAKSTLSRLKIQQFELEDRLKASYPKYLQLANAQIIPSIQNLQKKLLFPSQILVEFFFGDSTIYILSLTQKTFNIHQLPKTAINQKIASFRAAIRHSEWNNHTASQFQKTAFSLYQLLLQPTLLQLPEIINEIIIIPDGQLVSIPFEILLTKAPNEKNTYNNLLYLLKKYTITYAQSATLLLHYQNKKPSKATELLAGFAPIFKGNQMLAEARSCSAEELSALAYSQEEITTIAELTGEKAYLETAASKTNFLKNIQNYRILHLATHACVDNQNPAHSRIYLSDDYFYLHELYNLDLNAEMVVLSACETGIGKYQRGEGTMSLSHGFAYSGVPSITMSLWSVNDQSTSELMQYYYQHLQKGSPKHQALRQAKLDYLNNQESTARLHPFYWAGFIHVGDFRAMEFSADTNYYWLLGIIGILFIAFFLSSVIKVRQHRSHL